jgi:N-acetylglutamate synthase-like GNAT family acetyltransferase
MMVEITTYSDKYLSRIIELILTIQQKEFNIPVTLEAQPDLQQIPEIYQTAKGNFWVALHDDQPVGTIGLIDIGDNIGVIRKMFVQAEYRGKVHKISHQLLQTLMQWAMQNKMKNLFLGTVEQLQASHRFYEKNGFTRIPIQELPKQFPLMKVDTIFYQYAINKNKIDQL